MSSATDGPLKDTLNLHWKNDKSAFGFRMLKKMGWSEDKGLGKNEDGAKSAVKLDKRDSSLGLGMEADSAGNLAWNSTSSSFTDILKMLNTTYSEETKKKDKAAKKKGSAGSARVQVGVKYKKLTAAKDLSTKSASDLKSIFGFDPHSNAAPTVNSGSIAGSITSTTHAASMSNSTTATTAVADASISGCGEGDEKGKKRSKSSKREVDSDILHIEGDTAKIARPKKSKKSKRRSGDEEGEEANHKDDARDDDDDISSSNCNGDNGGAIDGYDAVSRKQKRQKGEGKKSKKARKSKDSDSGD